MANNSELFDLHQDLDSFQDERFFMFQLTSTWKIVMLLLMTGSLIIGSSAKVAIYQHIFNTKLADLPINILIFIEHLLNHLSNMLTLASLCTSFLFGITIGEMVEAISFSSSNSYCWFIFYNSTFMVSYSATDGLGIAIVRLLYIKKGSWLRYDFGEMKMMKITSISSIIIAALLTFMYGLETSSNRSAYNLCTGHSQEFQKVLLDYLNALSRTPGTSEDVFWTVFATAAANILVVLELFCYLTFFHYIYCHNSGAVVSSAIRKARNNANAQTMVGQIYLFFIEAIFFGIVIATNMLGQTNSTRIKDIAVTYKLVEFALLSAAHCFQIPEIRKAMMNRLSKIKASFKTNPFHIYWG